MTDNQITLSKGSYNSRADNSVYALCTKLSNFLKDSLPFCKVGFDNVFQCYDINTLQYRNFRIDMTVKFYDLENSEYKTILLDIIRTNSTRPFSATQKSIDQKYKHRNTLIFKKYGLKVLNLSKKAIKDLDNGYGSKLLEIIEKHAL